MITIENIILEKLAATAVVNIHCFNDEFVNIVIIDTWITYNSIKVVTKLYELCYLSFKHHW